MTGAVERVVREYYELVGSLDASTEAVGRLLGSDVRVVEHPNAVTPNGAVRDRAAVLTALRAGRGLLREQRFEVHEVLVVGDRAAARATWTAEIGMDRRPFTAGMRLTAEVASFLTVRDGRVVDQETFDCYPPLPTAGETPRLPE